MAQGRHHGEDAWAATAGVRRVPTAMTLNVATATTGRVTNSRQASSGAGRVSSASSGVGTAIRRRGTAASVSTRRCTTRAVSDQCAARSASGHVSAKTRATTAPARDHQLATGGEGTRRRSQPYVTHAERVRDHQRRDRQPGDGVRVPRPGVAGRGGGRAGAAHGEEHAAHGRRGSGWRRLRSRPWWTGSSGSPTWCSCCCATSGPSRCARSPRRCRGTRPRKARPGVKRSSVTSARCATGASRSRRCPSTARSKWATSSVPRTTTCPTSTWRRTSKRP